jgi:16S rRNA U516 pseudouridylate synthase RsuA-like enzyme
LLEVLLFSRRRNRERQDRLAMRVEELAREMAVLGQRAAVDAIIDIDPRARAEQARSVTVLLHKPIGYVSGQPEPGYQPAVTLIRDDTRWAEDRGPRFSHGMLKGLAPAGPSPYSSAVDSGER